MIYLKYTERYKRKKFKFSAGFYAVIACCLLLIGGASWFSLSKISNTVEVPKNNVIPQEYKDDTSSYIESVPEIPEITVPSEETTQNVTDVPHTGNKENVSKPQEPVIAFTMPVQGKVLKDFSKDRLQYSATYGDMRIHKGVDIECEKGTKISACADGTVLAVVRDANLGTIVEIDHGNSITIKYAAISNPTVKEGDAVKLGDIIGDSTTVPSECNDKNHIHLEVFKDSKPVSPLETLGLK